MKKSKPLIMEHKQVKHTIVLWFVKVMCLNDSLEKGIVDKVFQVRLYIYIQLINFKSKTVKFNIEQTLYLDIGRCQHET